MKPVLAALFLFALLAVLIVVGTAIFIGLGALLARWLPLSLFEAAGLAIGTTIALAAIVHVVATMMRAHPSYELDDDFDEEEDDLDAALPESDDFLSKPDLSKVARNDHCPCGSGKKFKNCCGKLPVK